MSTYKVPQDVEAEDKLIGNLTFRQFIYLCIAVGMGFVAFGLYQVEPVLVVIPAPLFIAFGILGFYHREDQPAESYIIAFLNFAIKPRKRIWNPSGVIETVRITAPKKKFGPEKARPLDQVEGQLHRIAKVLDTRGWAVKRPELQEPGANPMVEVGHDDRLVSPILKQDTEPIDVHAADDVLDLYNNPVAQTFESMINEAEERQHQAVVAKMQTAASSAETLPADLHYNPYPAQMHQKVIGGSHEPVKPKKTKGAKHKKTAHKPKSKAGQPPSISVMTTPVAPGILQLSDELTVSQIAAHANRKLSAGEEVSLRHATNSTRTKPNSAHHTRSSHSAS